MKNVATLTLRKKLNNVLKKREKVFKKNREGMLKKLSEEMDNWKKKHLKETIDIIKAIREIREGR